MSKENISINEYADAVAAWMHDAIQEQIAENHEVHWEPVDGKEGSNQGTIAVKLDLAAIAGVAKTMEELGGNLFDVTPLEMHEHVIEALSKVSKERDGKTD